MNTYFYLYFCLYFCIFPAGGGSSMLRQPQRIESVCRAASSLLSCPLTIKIRKGYEIGHDNVHTWLPRVNEWGVTAVTLHGRTREQVIYIHTLQHTPLLHLIVSLDYLT